MKQTNSRRARTIRANRRNTHHGSDANFATGSASHCNIKARLRAIGVGAKWVQLLFCFTSAKR